MAQGVRRSLTSSEYPRGAGLPLRLELGPLIRSKICLVRSSMLPHSAAACDPRSCRSGGRSIYPGSIAACKAGLSLILRRQSHEKLTGESRVGTQAEALRFGTHARNGARAFAP